MNKDTLAWRQIYRSEGLKLNLKVVFSFLFRSKSKDHKVNKILCDLPRY